jgi:hypothetical protein
MSGGDRVEVHVQGRVGGDLLAMLDALHPRVEPRHTVITVARDAAGADLVGVLWALQRAGIELERVTVRS